MARPKRTLHQKDLQAIRDMLERHLSWSQIARGLRMDFYTLKRLRDEDGDLKRIADEVLESERADLHNVVYDEAIKGNVIAAFFLLKTRHGYRENAPVDVAVNGNVIMLPAPATPEDYARMLSHASVPANGTAPALQAPRALPAAEAQRG